MPDRHAVLALTLLGLALRLYGLEDWGLWTDEAWTWWATTAPTLGECWRRVANDVHPPGHPLMLRAWLAVAPDAVWSLRLPSVVLGTCTVPLTYLLGRRLFDRATGLMAAALVASAFAPVHYGQEARPYAGVLLFSTGLVLALLRARDAADEGRPVPASDRLGLLLALVGLSWFHYLGLMLAGLSLLGLLVVDRRAPTWRALGPVYALWAVSYLPWVPELLADLGRDPIWIQHPGSLPFAAVVWLRFHFKYRWQTRGLALLGVAGWARLGLTGREAEGDHGRPRASARLCLAWVVVPFGLVYLKSVLSAPVFTARNLLIASPALLLLLARGLTALAPRRAPWASAFVVAGLVAAGHFTGGAYPPAQRLNDLRSPMDQVRAAERAGTGPVHLLYSHFYQVLLHHELKSVQAFAAGRTHPVTRPDEVQGATAWVEAVPPEHELWFVWAHSPPPEQLKTWLAARFPDQRCQDFRGSQACRLRAASPRPAGPSGYRGREGGSP